MKKIFILILLFQVLIFKPQNCFAQTTAADTALTFVLSNEAPGYLIDNIIANGYGDSCLHSVLVALQPLSGGVISEAFLDTLAALPVGSEIFTTHLANYTGFNNPVCINTDGTIRVNDIYGKEYFQQQGYQTYNDTLVPVGLKLFTYAQGPQYYIDAGSSAISGGTKTYYKAFAIAWSLGSTFVLTNEGGLIDDLIRAGHGDKNLYQTLEVLKPNSGGVISDEFMATLANCPKGSEVFTATLNNYSGINNPVGINNDGSLIISPIFGKDYISKTGYSTFPENKSGYIPVLFTYTNSIDKYIDTGSSIDFGGDSNNYKAFAIAWKPSTTFVLTNEGGLIDDLIRAGHGDKNLYQTLEVLKPNSGGVISDEFMATLANCPKGSEIFTAALSNFGGLNNPVCINTDGTLTINGIFGNDYLTEDGYTTLPLNHGGYISELFTVANSAESYIDAGSSGTSGGTQTNYKAFAIAWKASTTFVLSNEGGLIDDLIRAGHGDKNLYQTLEILKPNSGGVISDEFMATLANCPTGSDIFTAALSNFAGLNNPVCVNSDGTLGIRSIFAWDYYLKEGFATYPESQSGAGRELFTYALNTDYCIDAGAYVANSDVYRYKAFAIAWSAAAVGIRDAETSLKSPSVYPNPFSEGFNIHNLPEQTRIEIFDIRGKLLYQTESKANSVVQPGLLPKGIYILKLRNSQGSWQQGIVKF